MSFFAVIVTVTRDCDCDLSAKAATLRRACDVVGSALREKMGNILRLTKDLQGLDTAGVLLGDHHIKLARQSYFAAKQEQVGRVDVGTRLPWMCVVLAT